MVEKTFYAILAQVSFLPLVSAFTFIIDNNRYFKTDSRLERAA